MIEIGKNKAEFAKPDKEHFSLENVIIETPIPLIEDDEVKDAAEIEQDEIIDEIMKMDIETMMNNSKKNLTKEEFDIFSTLGLDKIVVLLIEAFKIALKPLKGILEIAWTGIGGFDHFLSELFGITTNDVLDAGEWFYKLFVATTGLLLTSRILSFINQFLQLFF